MEIIFRETSISAIKLNELSQFHGLSSEIMDLVTLRLIDYANVVWRHNTIYI